MSVPDRTGICQSIICGHTEILFLKPISERRNCVVEGLSTQAPQQHRNKCKFGVSRSQTDDPLKQTPSARTKIDARWKMSIRIWVQLYSKFWTIPFYYLQFIPSKSTYTSLRCNIFLRWHYFEKSKFRPEMQTFTNSGNWRVWAKNVSNGKKC